jgi:hypothetical protein
MQMTTSMKLVTDELGMVIATSTYGDEGDGLHGDASLSTYTIILPANIQKS